jgi:hypothetical protein
MEALARPWSTMACPSRPRRCVHQDGAAPRDRPCRVAAGVNHRGADPALAVEIEGEPAVPSEGGEHGRSPIVPRWKLLVSALVVLGFGFFSLAWVFTNPAGYSSDEPAHYTKAIGLAHGSVRGGPGAYPVGPGFGPEQLLWINRATRAFEIPPGLAPDGFACNLFQPHVSAACLDDYVAPQEAVPRLTYVGSYEPFLYVPPAMAMRLAQDPFTALFLARLVEATIAVGLLAAATALLWSWESGGLSLVGLLLAATPTALFYGSSLSPNGTEIAGGICLLAAVIRLSRPGRIAPGVWLAFGASAGITAMARSLGPVWVALAVCLLLATVGIRRARSLVRENLRWALPALVLAAVGVGATAAWQALYQPRPRTSLSMGLNSLLPAMSELPWILDQWIGRFGWADVPLPSLATAVWKVMLLALTILAMVVGTRRQRWVLTGVVMASVLTTAAVSAFLIRQTNFPMQGRYVLPVVVVVPLFAGEVLWRGRARLGGAEAWARRWGLLLFAVPVAAVHVTALYVNWRRHAVGVDGPALFFFRSEWEPIAGWGPWVLVVAAAVGALIAGAAISGRVAAAGAART